MIIRYTIPEDIDIIDKMEKDQDHFKLGDIEKSIIQRIVFDEDTPVAYGLVKQMGEAIMLTNPKVSIMKRAVAMQELMKYAEIGAKKAGCEQLHCFVKESKLALSLEKHFGFVQTEDIVLVKNLL